MDHKNLLRVSAIFCLVLSSCGKIKSTATEPLLDQSPSPFASATPPSTPTSTPVAFLDYPEYNLQLDLDYTQKSAQVEESIHYQNQSGGDLTSIVLAVEPNLWAGCFALKEIRINGLSINTFRLEGQRLELTRDLSPLEIVTISIDYSLTIPWIEVDNHATIIRTQVFGYTPRQLNLVDWYPFVVPYEPGKGWILNEPATYGEHLVYGSANFEVSVHFSGSDSPPIVAASGEEIPAAEGKHYQLLKGRSFAFSFSPDYLIKSQEQDGVNVLSYYYPSNALAGQAALDATLRALQVFSQDFSAYPHPTLSIVQEETAFSMEYDGLYFLERPLYFGYSGVETDVLPSIAAHETAHQWWFALVGTNQAYEPWLDESLSTYSERLFNESYGTDKGNWWYLWRISLAKEKDCPVDISIYGFYGYNCFYTESVYMRGALFLQALRDRLGDEVFLGFLKDFATQYTHQIASTQDFFNVLRQHSETDLTDILHEFFQNPY